MGKLHPGKINNLGSKIHNLLNYISIDVNNFVTFNNPVKDFEPLEFELKKECDVFDTFTTVIAFIDAVYYYANFIAEQDLSDKNLSELQNKEKDEIESFVLEYLTEIPFEYTVRIQLSNISIADYHAADSKITVNTVTSGESKITNIETRSNGYYTYQNSEIFIKEPLQDLNVLLYFLLVTKSITHKPPTLKSFGLQGSQIQKYTSIQILLIPEKYKRSGHKPHMPMHISKYLGELSDSLNFETLQKSGRTMIAVETACNIINSKSEGAEYIRSAIDWHMNSLYNTDKTMAFIQTCMGLEALLGEKQNGAGSLTRTLADRCAYLIGNGLEERKIIKKDIEDIYALRSNIVHGVTNKIKNSEKRLVELASRYLNKAIASECRFVI